MAKMFYTQEEAQAKLGVADAGLKQLVTDNKLREFRDNNRIMFKVDQVDKLASDRSGAPAGSPGDSGIGLAPLSGGSSMDALSLADSKTSAGKDDTIMTASPTAAAPKSAFKTDAASPSDTSAQTQIQPAVDDQLSLESVGSGSGLLDLTRERDDTSLGAELLDEIYPGGDATKGPGATGMGIGSSSGIFEPPAADISGPSGLDNMAAPAPIGGGGPEIVEARDPAAGAFGGFALAAVLAMLITFIVTAAAAQGFSPDWAATISSTSTNVLIFGVILLVVALLLAGVGFFVGKATTR